MRCFTVYDKYVDAVERDRKVGNFYNNSNSEKEVFDLAVNPKDIWCLKTSGLIAFKLIRGVYLKKKNV